MTNQLHVEFSESSKLAFITVFKQIKDKAKYEVRQKGQEIVISRNGELYNKYVIYKPAKIVAVHNDDYKVGLVLHKEEEGKWEGIEGPEVGYELPKTDYTEEIPDKPRDLWGMLEDVYFNGDEEVKSAMIKSFRDSQGKVLNSNWKQVNDKK